MNTPSDILFLFPPAHGNLGVFKNHLGVAYLRAALQRDGIDSEQYYNECPGTLDSVTDDILSRKPRIVGFTVYDANFSVSLALARRIKKKNDSVIVVFGGPSATFGASHLLAAHDAIDVCVRGEAEETGSRILSALLNGDEPTDAMPGIVFKRNGSVVTAPLPPLVGCNGTPDECTLDATPSPYLSGILTNGKPGVLSGRGCTHNCQYCCFAALGRKRLRLHSIERVVAELSYIAGHQQKSGEHYVVAVHDDAFTLMSERAKALCRAIIDKKLGLALSCITRADAIDEELVTLMREAGFMSLAFGLESAVPSVLRATGKVKPPQWPDPDLEPERRFVEQVKNGVDTAHRLNMSVGVSIILGLPTETVEQGKETLRFVKSLPVDYYMHNYLWLFPGTPLWETRREYGIDCEINSIGLPVTTKYAYDITRLRPVPRCSLEQDARFVKMLARDSLYSCGCGAACNGGVGAVIVNSSELNPNVLAWLGDVLDIGGNLVQVYPKLSRREKNVALYRDRMTLSEHLVPARHHMQLLPLSSDNGGERWSVACAGVDLYNTFKPKLLRLDTQADARPFHQWLLEGASKSDYCDVAMELTRPKVIMDFLAEQGDADISEKMKCGGIPPSLRYPGRWVNGKAPCLSCTRIEIDDMGAVRTCRHGEAIGSVGDSKESLKASLHRKQREIEGRRGCDGCDAAHCPRCPFPGIDDSLYCAIMKSQRKALHVCTLAHVFSRIPMIMEQQRDRMGSD